MAEAGQGECLLDQDRRPEQRPEDQAAGGQDRQGRSPHVHGRDPAARHTPRAREGHVVLAQFCADGCACDAHKHGSDAGGQGDGGQGEMPEGVGQAGAFAEDGEPAEHESENIEEDEPESEAGCGHADDGPADDGAVDPRSFASRGNDSQGNADGDGQEERSDGEPRGEGDAGREDIRDGGR